MCWQLIVQGYQKSLDKYVPVYHKKNYKMAKANMVDARCMKANTIDTVKRGTEPNRNLTN